MVWGGLGWVVGARPQTQQIWSEHALFHIIHSIFSRFLKQVHYSIQIIVFMQLVYISFVYKLIYFYCKHAKKLQTIHRTRPYYRVLFRKLFTTIHYFKSILIKKRIIQITLIKYYANPLRGVGPFIEWKVNEKMQLVIENENTKF